MRIAVRSSEICTYSEHEDRDWGSWSEDYDFSIDRVSVVKEDYKLRYNEDAYQIADDATNVYVIVMRYSTGDSFGNASGKGEVIHAFGNREAAETALEVIKTQEDERSFVFKDDFGREVSYYNCGAGYFESILSIDIEVFAI